MKKKIMITACKYCKNVTTSGHARDDLGRPRIICGRCIGKTIISDEIYFAGKIPKWCPLEDY